MRKIIILRRCISYEGNYSIVLFLTIGQSTSLSLGLCRNSVTSRKARTQDSIFGYRSKFNYFVSNELVLNAVLFSMIFKSHYHIHLSRFSDCSTLQETCEILATVLKIDYMKAPSSVSQWNNICRDFWLKWNFPNCIGER